MNNQQPSVAKDSEVEKEEEESSVITNSLEHSSKVHEKSDIIIEDDEHPSAIVAMVTEKEVSSVADDPMDEDIVNPATVFCIRLKQPRSNLLHKMSVPELCRNFREFDSGRRSSGASDPIFSQMPHDIKGDILT